MKSQNSLNVKSILPMRGTAVYTEAKEPRHVRDELRGAGEENEEVDDAATSILRRSNREEPSLCVKNSSCKEIIKQ